MEDLRNCWWAFYQFSKDQREFFHLMFVDRSVPAITDQWQGFGQLQQMLERVAARIQRLVDVGVFPAALNPQVALHVLWAALTGPAVLVHLPAGTRRRPGRARPRRSRHHYRRPGRRHSAHVRALPSPGSVDGSGRFSWRQRS